MCTEAGNSAYSIFKYIGDAVWSGVPLKDTYFVILRAYYDASSQETVESKPLVMASLVSTQEGWCEFERGWNRVLDLFGVPYLHMKEYAHSTNVFSEWRGNDDKRAQFLSALIDVIDRAVIRAHIFTILPRDFNTVNRVYSLSNESWPSAYPLVFLMASHMAERWMMEYRPDARLGHFVEKGDAGQGALKQFVDQADINSPVTIATKYNERTGDRVRPFEACDFVAYEFYLSKHRELTGNDPTGRRSLRNLAARLSDRIEAGTLTEQGLTKWCRAYPENYPRREGS